MALLSANIILCETVLSETPPKGGGTVPSFIRVMGAIAIAQGNSFVHFFSITLLSSQPGDFSEHILKIQVIDKDSLLIAHAPEMPFKYGYLVDPSGPGGFV